jgi:hypothetical protein
VREIAQVKRLSVLVPGAAHRRRVLDDNAKRRVRDDAAWKRRFRRCFACKEFKFVRLSVSENDIETRQQEVSPSVSCSSSDAFRAVAGTADQRT